MDFYKLESNIELGLRWLRTQAQVYPYSCSKIGLGFNFYRNLISCGIKLNWGLDGCARWRKVTITIAIT